MDNDKPYLIVVDDDPQVLRAIRRDLRRQYRENYRIQHSTSAGEALEFLKEVKRKGEAVAMFVSDQRMPEMMGVEFLDRAREMFPAAKRILLTAYSDTDAAIQGINDAQLDYYLLKPWDPPAEKLYPILDDQLAEWESSYVPLFRGIRVVGYPFAPKSHSIKNFLAGNLLPYQFLDVEKSNVATELLEQESLTEKDLPVVFFEDGSYQCKPDPTDIAKKLGLRGETQHDLYDVIIIGAGPSGLAAAVYGGSEGLNTLLIEKERPGGQAGTSSRIENYLGFPNGLSGSDLTRRALDQAKRFGVEFHTSMGVKEIRLRDAYKVVVLEDGTEVIGKSVVIATGVSYRKLEAEGLEKFSGAGVYYGAATTEANSCNDRDVYIVGGGNSAGQGAMYLSNFARNVYIAIRGDSLQKSMSQYLIEQIEATPNIELLTHTEVREASGDDRLRKLCLFHNQENKTRTVDASALFIFIGARPFTDWIGLDILKNSRGFIETGPALRERDTYARIWKKQREPFLLETSHPGIFAAGDVRAGAMNRVASAVGEGAMSIKFVHQYLAEL